MEEELKKEQVKKHSREENEKVTTFSFPTDDNSPSNVVILVVRNDSNFKLCRQETVCFCRPENYSFFALKGEQNNATLGV